MQMIRSTLLSRNSAVGAGRITTAVSEILLSETLVPRLAMFDKMRENTHPIQVRGSKAIMMCGKNPEEHWLSCQLTFCPLGSETFLDEIEEALEIIRQSGLEYEIGSMSTIVKGPGSEVLALLERIAVTMDERGCRFSMPATLSNLCGLQ